MNPDLIFDKYEESQVRPHHFLFNKE